jgi:hypothetical protein
VTTDTQKKTIIGDGHYHDDTVHYKDDFELMFCQEGRVSEARTKNAGVFDYDKACNQECVELSPCASCHINVTRQSGSILSK